MHSLTRPPNAQVRNTNTGFVGTVRLFDSNLRNILEFGMQIALRVSINSWRQHLLNEREIAGCIEHVSSEV